MLIKKNPLISVIMSVKDDEKNIYNSVNSILNQSYKNFELLIVDDASVDRTFEILKSLNSEKIKIFRNKNNLGLTKSLNFLIEQSNGNYIARQDSDDISFEDRLQTQVEAIIKTSAHLVTTRAIIKGSNKKIPGISFYLPLSLSLKFKNPIIHGTMLIKKQTLLDLGGYDEEFKYAQDYRLILNFYKNRYKILQLNKVLYKLNMENNISKNFKQEQAIYADLARKKNFSNH